MVEETTFTFAQHKEKTAEDLEAVAAEFSKCASQVREGNMEAFEKFIIEGGTEEGDAKLDQHREMLIIRYVFRSDHLKDS